MAQQITCEKCCFYAPARGEQPQEGECRRRAPERNWRVAEWPVVRKDDFCGEFVEAAS